MALHKQNFDDRDEQYSVQREQSRQTIDISFELYQKIEMAAKRQDISTEEYLEKILERMIPIEDWLLRKRRPVTQETINIFRQLQQDSTQGRNGEPFSDSTEIIRQMREERTRELDQR